MKSVPKADSAMNKTGPMPPEDNCETPQANVALNTALTVLGTMIESAHNNVSDLRAALEPVLPIHMFGTADGTGCNESDSPYRPTSGADLSPTLIAVNIQLNEIDRLITRINYIRQQLVL